MFSSPQPFLDSSALNQLALKNGVHIIQDFNQNVENKKYDLKQGQCTGLTHFWLCAHLLKKIKNIDELLQLEKKILQDIKSNYGEVILLQKAYGDPTHVPKETLSQLGSLFLIKESEASFKCKVPLVYFKQRTKNGSLYSQANAFTSALSLTSEEEKYLSFQYNWTDDAVIKNEYYRDEVDNRCQHGHRIGMIKNPCPGIDILFFDSNRGIYAFPQQTFFREWITEYFKFKLRKNGVPVAYLRSYASVADNALAKEKSAVQSPIKEK